MFVQPKISERSFIQGRDLRGQDLRAVKVTDSLSGCTLDEQALKTLTPCIDDHIYSNIDGINVVGMSVKECLQQYQPASVNLGIGFGPESFVGLSREELQELTNELIYPAMNAIRVIGDWSARENQQLFFNLFADSKNGNKIHYVKIDASAFESIFRCIRNKALESVILIGDFQKYFHIEDDKFLITVGEETYHGFGDNNLPRSIQIDQQTAKLMWPLLQDPAAYGLSEVALRGLIDEPEFLKKADLDMLSFKRCVLTKETFEQISAHLTKQEDGSRPKPTEELSNYPFFRTSQTQPQPMPRVVTLTGDLTDIDFSIFSVGTTRFTFEMPAVMDKKTFMSFIPHEIIRQGSLLQLQRLSENNQEILSLKKRLLADVLTVTGEFTETELVALREKGIDLELLTIKNERHEEDREAYCSAITPKR